MSIFSRFFRKNPNSQETSSIQQTGRSLNLELASAVEHGNRSDVEHLIGKGANVNGTDKDGWFPLLLATKNEDAGLVKFLLKNGANVNQLMPEISTLERLGFEKSAIDRKNRGVSALIVASRKGSIDIVNVLLSNGADIDTQDGDGLTALHGAAQYGYCSITEVLLQKNATIDMKSDIGFTPLILSCGDRGDIKVVDLLLKKGTDVNARTRENTTALHEAAEFGKHEIARMLLDKGADVDAKGYEGQTALHLATKKGHQHVVKVLLDAGANKELRNDDGVSALDLALDLRDRKILNLLDPASEYSLPSISLIEASFVGDVFTVKELLDSGEDVNAGNDNNATPLFMAAQEGHIDTAKLLIERGADVNAKLIEDAETSLLTASKFNHWEIVALLLDKGADVDAKGGVHGRTALHEAACSGYEETVRMLLARGADVFATEAGGRTPLELMEAGLFYKKDQENYKMAGELLRNAERKKNNT